MSIRQRMLTPLLILLLATSAFQTWAQPRPASLEPSAAARQLAPVINESLGLARSEMSAVAIDRRDPASITAQVLLDGELRTLELHPHSVRAPNYQVLVQQPDGSLKRTAPGLITTLRGKVAGIPDSEVAGSLNRDGLRALVLIPGKPRTWIEPIPALIAAAGDAHVIYTDVDRRADGPACATSAPSEGLAEAAAEPDYAVVSAASFGENDIRWAQLAVDSDVEYYNFHGGSIEAVEAEINEVISISNIEYQRDVGIGHYVVTIVIRPTEPDPFSAFNPSNLLDQFRNHWFQFNGGIERDVAHLFTGRTLGNGLAGIAYISGICDDIEGYSLVSRVAQFCSALACRTDLTAHELGHNWAASHCSCPGWTMNPAVQSGNRFHPDFSIPQIVTYRDTRQCLEVGDTLTGVTVTAPITTMAENNAVPLDAFAQFEFNYDQNVTDQVAWSVEPASLGSVSPDGVFTSNEVAGPLNGAITATYTFDSTTEIGSMNITVVDAQPAPLPDSGLPDKVRYISVAPPAPGASVALQVRIVSLYNPDPPDVSPGSDFSGWEGYTFWVGQPQTCNDSGGGGTFACARLDCFPYYSASWGSQVIHVTAPEIIPSSEYAIRSFPISCQGEEDRCGVASAMLTVRTQRWGDIVAPFQAPGGPRQPNATDIAAAVDKVRNVPGSIAMLRVQLQPAIINSNGGASAIDIAMTVDAVKGAAYPLAGPCLCPPFFTCPFADECGRCLPP